MLTKILLAPLLLLQGLHVRRSALRLPEAAGERSGRSGEGGPALRLLIVGDSSAAGVGAPTQDQALAGRLADALARRLGRSVHWRLIASTGHTSADALAAFELASPEQADVLVTALGVNDVVSQVRSQSWLRQLAEIDRIARLRLGVRYTLHSALPPMHAFALLPQPLRWVLGQDARRMNQALARDLGERPDRQLLSLPGHLHDPASTAALMAEDGFHPGPEGYRIWAEALAEQIAGAVPGRLRSH